jgi:uncharacterized protein (DUF362 family)
MPTRARVALIRTTAITVLNDYERLLDLVEFRRHLDPSATTILQIDVSRHFPFPAANTTPWQLEGTARALRAAGYADLAWTQRRPTIANPFKGTDLSGYAPIMRDYGIAACASLEPSDTRWVRYEPSGPMLVLDRVWKHAIEIPGCFCGANIVHLPTIRTDSATGMAGAMWSVAGGLHDPRRYPPRRWMHELLVDLLTVQREIQAGCLAVVDGTTIGNGPQARVPEVRNVILASADPVAVDAVAARLMGFEPLRDLKYVRLAHERGLGCGDVRAIELVGDIDLARESWRFSAGNHAAGLLDSLVQPGSLRLVRQLFGGTPLDGVIGGMERYNEYYRWPVQSRRVFESWLRGTHWGELFQRYCKRFQGM